MGAGRTDTPSFWATTLNAAITATDLAYPVVDIQGLTSPARIAIDPEDSTKREVILADGVFSGNTIRSSGVAGRGLQGSAGGVAHAHAVGAVVWVAPLGQHFGDVWDALENHGHQTATTGGKLDHGAGLIGLNDDDHNQYLLASGLRAMAGDLNMGGHRVANDILAANLQTAAYTLVLADANKVVELNAASAVTLTVPPNSSVAFPVGTIIEVCQIGAGQVTVATGAGVSIDPPTRRKLAGQFSSATLRKRTTDGWIAAGLVS